MNKQEQTICVFGGTGFVGRYVVQKLAHQGYRIKVASRSPQSAYFLRTYGVVGQIVPVLCDYSEDSIKATVKGCDYVVNTVGVLYEKGKNSFEQIHKILPENIAKACAKEKVKKLVHISALGIENSHSKYAKSKLDGEEAIKDVFKNYIVLRPSIVFGPEDDFFNRFARMAKFSPFLPLIGGGKTMFQPVYVNDVAEAVKICIVEKDLNSSSKCYELGGPEKVSFKNILNRIQKIIGTDRSYIGIPFWIAKLQGFFMSLLPGEPILTADQVKSLQSDNVESGQFPDMQDMGITPTAMGLVVPRYLDRHYAGGKFAASRKSAKV
ncbi:MAG: NAD-dependent dehydratase [Alphaproteobacteria bacterium]|nr:NAD-dependent dehydratase [Alphaproteobacteria bacterium]